MTKAEQFLWIVQTMTIRNAINLTRRDDLPDQYITEISATGAFIICDEAIRASEMIPISKSAAEAAHDFCFYMFDNLRESEERQSEMRSVVPVWFAR